MKKGKEEILLMLDYLQGPIWTSNIETGEPFTEVDIVNEDPIVRELNRKCGQMYSSYYYFDHKDLPCYFDKEAQKREKEIMLDLIAKLTARLEEINDGSYVIKDLLTDDYKKL